MTMSSSLPLAAQGATRPPARPLYPTEQQMARSKEARQHVANAMEIAKPDLIARAQNFCTATGPQEPAVKLRAAGKPADARRAVEPTKIFDNLYYIGFNDVGAWAIATSAGIIMIDSLSTPQEAEAVIVPGLRKLKLNPANIKYVVIGHGHPDHFGGASYLQGKFGARVAVGTFDWDVVEKGPPNAPPQEATRPRPKRDMVLADRGKLTLGDTTLTFFHTPGHTDGSLAILIPVQDKGRPYTALMLSGANEAPNQGTLLVLDQVLAEVKRQNAAILLNGHPGLFGEELAWMEGLRKNPAEPNPFVYGEERFGRLIDIMIECARARLAAMFAS
jgi:metallo-beta-lactamase class B